MNAETGFPGSPKIAHRPARPKRNGLPGLTETRHKSVCAPTDGEGRLHQIARTDRDAAHDDQDIVIRGPCATPLRWRGASSGAMFDCRVGDAALCRKAPATESSCFRRFDPPRAVPGLDQFVSRRDDRRAHLPAHFDLAESLRREQRQRLRPNPFAHSRESSVLHSSPIRDGERTRRVRPRR